jgi:hypothetical protein
MVTENLLSQAEVGMLLKHAESTDALDDAAYGQTSGEINCLPISGVASGGHMKRW